MTEEEINIEIATYLGRNHPTDKRGGKLTCPDYCNDLNAMHRVEEGLTEKQQLFYQVWLMKIQKADYVAGCWFAIHATASRRAEAFLKTIGKWKE